MSRAAASVGAVLAIVVVLTGTVAVSAPVAAPVTATQAVAFTGGYVPAGPFPTSWQARELLIRIVCPAQTQATARPGDFSFCTGTLVVTYQGNAIATAPFSIRTWDSHVERVRVRDGARALFQPGRRVQVRWRARSHDGRGRWITRTGAITVFNPYNRL